MPELGTACAAPSVMMDFDPYGNVLACCANVLYPLGNVQLSTLDEIWSGERAEQLRHALARGDLGYGCGNCRHRLTYHGGEVPRDVYDHYVPAAGIHPETPQILGFSLHNTCNLECIMCGADSSSRIRSNRSSLGPLRHVYSDDFFQQLEPFLAHCRWADFRGGEPFLVREHHRVWDLMAETGWNGALSVTTNGTLWNKRVEAVLDRFDTSIVLSFDGVTPATFESVRKGSDLSAVLENLDRYRTYALERGTDLQLSYCLLQQNWFEFSDVLLFAEGLGLETSVHTVLEPAYGVQRLPTDELQHVLHSLESEDQRMERELSLNLAVWRRELDRLRSELDDRKCGRARRWIGEPPGPNNVRHVADTMMTASSRDRSLRGLLRFTRQSARARRYLRAWSDEGLTGTISVDSLGRVVSCDLGKVFEKAAPNLTAECSSLSEFLASIERATSSHLWVSEEFVESELVEHLLMFGHIDRDRVGLLVRALSTPKWDGGVVVHFAVDTNLLSSSPPWPSDSPADRIPGEVPVGLRAATPLQSDVAR